MNIRKRTFANTAAALAEFDKDEAKRRQAWAEVETTLDIACAEQDDRDALRKVQDAYHLDTQDINSAANCRMVDMHFLRRMAGAPNGQ
ncbi:MAG: hypothetical protein WKG03_03665 [Telluria sp.]